MVLKQASPTRAMADTKAPAGIPASASGDESVQPVKFTGKLPKTLAGCADRLYVVRQERLALQRQAEAFAAEETALREYLIDNLPKSSATGIAGKVCRASVETKTVWKADDWNKVRKYIEKEAPKNPGVWALLQKRLSDAAVKEVFASGKKIPGISRMEVPFVSLNKL
jgi:hypothetical protein